MENPEENPQQIEAGRLVLEHTDFSLRQTLESSLDVLAARAQEKDLTLASFIAPELPDHLIGDPTRIRQILLNFLSNAIKFTKPRNPAVIEIGSRLEDGQAVYYVKDNGVGFDMRYAHKLFGVFQRLHSTEEFEGTGVGLALVKRIVEVHGGRVWVESRGTGQGSTFLFTLAENPPQSLSATQGGRS